MTNQGLAETLLARFFQHIVNVGIMKWNILTFVLLILNNFVEYFKTNSYA